MSKSNSNYRGLNFFGRSLVSIKDKISNQDKFGQPITLTYHGKETFQTCPGGFLSITMSLLLLSYFLIKGNDMIQKSDWALVTQDILLSDKELI